MRTPHLSFAWLTLAALVAGCGDGTPGAKTPGDVATVDVQAPPDGPGSPPPPGASTTPTQPKRDVAAAEPADPPAPVAAPGPTAPSGGTAVFSGASSSPPPAIQALAATDAAGMVPAGSTLSAIFARGQTLDLPLQLLPGRCYAILAAGAPSVQAMQITVSASMPPLPPAVIAQASGAATASLGGKSTGCYKNPMPVPLPATVTVEVTAGTGPAAIQVYSK